TAEANISSFATRLGETQITSPLDGVVWQRKLDPGALVGTVSGATIVTVVRTDTLRAFAAFNERDATALRVGQNARIAVDAFAATPAKTFPGKVVRLAPGFDPTSRTLEAEVRVDNKSGLLRPGMYGRAAVTVDTHAHVPVLSASAMQIANSKRYVF